MADIAGNIDKMNDIEIASDAPLTQTLMDKIGANINALIDINTDNTETFTSNVVYVVPEGIGGADVWVGGVSGGGGGGGTSTDGGVGGTSSFGSVITFPGAPGGRKSYSSQGTLAGNTIFVPNGGPGSTKGGSGASTYGVTGFLAGENGQSSLTNAGGLGGDAPVFASVIRPGGGGGGGYLGNGGNAEGETQASTTPAVNTGAGGGGSKFSSAAAGDSGVGGGGGGGNQIVWHRVTMPAAATNISVTIGGGGAAGGGGGATAGASGIIILAFT